MYVGLLYLYFGLRHCPGEQERVLDSIWWDPLGFIGDPLGFAGIRTKNAIPPEDFSFFTEDPGLPSSCENSLGSAGVQSDLLAGFPRTRSDLQGFAMIHWDLLGPALKMQFH